MNEEGFVVLGKRPKSTFLTGAGRSVLVQRGDEPGTYLIDPTGLESAKRELEETRAELAELDRELATDPHHNSRLRGYRTKLLGAIRRLQGQVEEGQRVLVAAQRTRRSAVRAA